MTAIDADRLANAIRDTCSCVQCKERAQTMLAGDDRWWRERAAEGVSEADVAQALTHVDRRVEDGRCSEMVRELLTDFLARRRGTAPRPAFPPAHDLGTPDIAALLENAADRWERTPYVQMGYTMNHLLRAFAAQHRAQAAAAREVVAAGHALLAKSIKLNAIDEADVYCIAWRALCALAATMAQGAAK